MLDINGVELAVGDNVIYTNRNLNELHKGKVFKITAKKIIVKYNIDRPYSYQYPDPNSGNMITSSGVYKYHHNIMYSDQIMKLG